ncbi:MAG: DUF255 domain-containing protein [Acidobacteria bacterium]|nr:DUF255 domain-containing protein [Acidobacteriota bacterium]
MPDVDWHPWHTAAFLDAQRRRRPVLLLLETAWSPACARVRADVLSHHEVVQAVADTMVAVRVDADRRPDIADRYGLGHWPSLLILTPDGHILTGGTHPDASLAARIRAVADSFARTPHARETAPALIDEILPIDDVALTARIAEAVAAGDETRTVEPTPGSAPLAGVALFALARAAVAQDDAWARRSAAAIDALDDVRSGPEGRPYPHTRGVLACVPADGDWPAVARLEDQAEWTRVLARAVRMHPVQEWIDGLESLVRGLRAFRRDDGHWQPWLGANGPVLVDASARACRALIAAGEVLERHELVREAIDSVDVLASAAYARAAGVAHVLEGGRARGPMLLDDAMLLGHALLDGDAWRDNDVYRDLAEEIARTTLVRLQGTSGALVDRVAALAGAGQVGRLAEPHHPLTGNAEAARLLLRLFPDDDQARADARRLLRGVSADAALAGVFGAPVGLAWEALAPAGAITAAW